MSRVNFHVNLRLYLSLTLKMWTSLQFSLCSQKKWRSYPSLMCVCLSVFLSASRQLQGHGTDFRVILYWIHLLNCGCKLEFWSKTNDISTKNYIHFCKNLERNSPNIRSSEKCFGYKCETKLEHILNYYKLSLNFMVFDILKQEEAKT
jgi:hypothetical protein